MRDHTSRVHPIIPLAILETVRTLDAPPDDGMEEFHSELAVKRLGTSTTVAAQIARFRELADRDRVVDAAEATAFLRLVGRRHDAALVFTEAGRRAARWAEANVSTGSRMVWRVLPRPLRNRYGLRIARRLLARYFDVRLKVDGGRALAAAQRPPSVEATPDGTACKFYGAVIGEVLATYTAFEGAMVHEACAARQSAECRWVSAGSTGR